MRFTGLLMSEIPIKHYTVLRNYIKNVINVMKLENVHNNITLTLIICVKLRQRTCIILCTRQFLVTVHDGGRYLTVNGYLSQTQKHMNSRSSKNIDPTIIFYCLYYTEIFMMIFWAKLGLHWKLIPSL